MGGGSGLCRSHTNEWTEWDTFKSNLNRWVGFCMVDKRMASRFNKQMQRSKGRHMKLGGGGMNITRKKREQEEFNGIILWIRF